MSQKRPVTSTSRPGEREGQREQDRERERQGDKDKDKERDRERERDSFCCSYVEPCPFKPQVAGGAPETAKDLGSFGNIRCITLFRHEPSRIN